MNITDIPAVFQLCECICKYAERFGALLCRRKIATLNLEIASLKTQLDTALGDIRELQRKCEPQTPNQAAPGHLSHYRRITVGGFPVYALRPEYISPGDSPQLICPSCFDRGIKSELICYTCNDIVAINTYKRRKHLKCIATGCRFHVIVPPKLFDEALKPI